MTAIASGIILIAAFAASAAAAGFLAVAAFRRAGAREARATDARGNGLSLPHGFRARHFPTR